MSARIFFANLEKISDAQLQARKLCQWFRENPPRLVVLGFQEILGLGQLGHESLRNVLNPWLLTQALNEWLPEADRLVIFQEASLLGLPLVSALFSNPEPILPTPPEAAFHKLDPTSKSAKGEQVTLGERRSLAKSNNPKLLERLIFDPDPRVVHNLLDNPHCVEKWVLKLASQRPNRPPILRLIGCHRRWGVNWRVRKSLILNPHCPPVIAVLSLVSAPRDILLEVLEMEQLHPLLREAALALLQERNPSVT